MASNDSGEDSLWDQSVGCNNSWADMMDEEDITFKKNKSFGRSPLLRDKTHLKQGPIIKTIKEEPLDENACDVNVAITKEIKIQPNEILPNFSTSYSKRSTSPTINKEIAKDTKEFLQEDLSLTGHLNGFKLASPCKVEKKTPIKTRTPRRTPSKNSISYYLRSERKETTSELKVIKRKLQTDDVKNEISDAMLMPSPSKIRKENTPMKTPTGKQVRRKRGRESTGKRSSGKKSRDLETDPETLMRRQKQIEYGKNTIGYDRYRQLVPKDSRSKAYPKTPPVHLKFSRRAWDGLVKVWRQRLHFWDPPSEGGGDPACLEGPSDISDVSSTDGSLPNTPVQDKKRQDRKSWTLRSNTPRRADEIEDLDDDDDDDYYQGCTPLSPE